MTESRSAVAGGPRVEMTAKEFKGTFQGYRHILAHDLSGAYTTVNICQLTKTVNLTVCQL